ncbi:MAG TPA: efflux RND transporter periplasmic adaptor subunit [Terriglobia bacterium]|nr:efflux RND transporter periplasmic adaptor subunit [Terriglobia bacterium]
MLTGKSGGVLRDFGLDIQDVGPRIISLLSKSATHAAAQRGSAAQTCGKALPFRPILHSSSSSAQAGRLSLPACAEWFLLRHMLRKGRAFPQVGRRSRRSSLAESSEIGKALGLGPAWPAQEQWKKRTLCLISLPLALLLLMPSCSKKNAGEEGEGAEEGAANIVAEVTVTRVERTDIQSTLSVSGTVSALPNQDVRVSSLVPGRVARMMVAEGDHISEGQVLAKIDDRPFHDQVQQAEAAVDQAKANLENSNLSLDRNEKLLERGIAARKDVEDARTQAAVNKAQVSQAEAALALAQLNLARTDVRSPLTGMVVKRLLSVGEQVDGTAAQPVFEVANTSEVELYGNVPALYLNKIRVGQVLNISTDAFPGKVFQSHIVAISPAVDPSTNVGLVRIRIANGAGLLRLGMFLTAQVPLETHRNALVAALEAVYRDQDGNPEIYRVEGEKAEAVPVKLGIETKDRVELLSGAQEGETIILGGGYGLPAHAKVKVKS